MKPIEGDFHTHLRTGTSKFNDNDIRHIFRRAESNLGEGGVIGVTNFVDENGDNQNYELFLGDALKVRGIEYDKEVLLAIRYSNVRAIKSVEFETNVGHILGIGMPPKVKLKPQRNWREVVKTIRSFGGISALPNAYSWSGGVAYNLYGTRGRRELTEIMNEVDAVELVSGESYIFPRANNQESFDYLLKLRTNPLPISLIGCSNGHTIREIGDVSTSLDLEEDINTPEVISKDKLVDLIRNSLLGNNEGHVHSDLSSVITGIGGAIYHGIKLLASGQYKLTTI